MRSLTGKIIRPQDIPAEAARRRLKDEIIVFTNGVFDLLHRGHVEYLEKARALGTCLFVGLNSDESARRLNKGPARPLNDQQSRAVVLCALQWVDAIVIFEEDTPETLIHLLRPDVLVKGGDYSIAQVAGAPFVQSYGGRVEIIPLTAGFSTTALEQKIKNG